MEKAIAKRAGNGIRRSSQGNAEEGSRKAALKWLAAFIAVMAALTATNGALTELSTAMVTTVAAQRGSLERNITADGYLSAGEESAVWEQNLYRIDEIFVSVGDEIQAGDPLFRFDTAQIESLLADAEISLVKAINNRDSSLITNKSAPDTTIQDALLRYERQQEDYQLSVETQNRKVAEAYQAIEDAKEALEKAKLDYTDSEKTAYSSAYTTALESHDKALRSLNYAKEDLERAEAVIKEAAAALAAAEASGDAAAIAAAQAAYDDTVSRNESTIRSLERSLVSAQAEYDKAHTNLANVDVSNTVASKQTAIENAENTIKTRETAYETALRDRETALNTAKRSLDDAKTSYEKAVVQAGVSAANDRATAQKSALSLENTNLDIETKQAEVDAMKALMEADGVVYASMSGHVTALNLTRYATPQSGTPLVKLSDPGTGLTFTTQVSTTNADYMSIGDDVTFTLSDGSFTRGTITEINAVTDNANVKQIVVNVPGGTVGEKVKMRFSKRSDNYDALIPIAALRQDDDGYFVYAIRQDEDSLGSRTTVERIDVTLLDQDSTRAAVSGGIGRNDKLVERGDRTLSDGDRVRIGDS